MAEGARAAMSGSSEAGVLSDDVFQRELDAFVARSAQATTWRVERLLKQSDFETTELVEGEPRGVLLAATFGSASTWSSVRAPCITRYGMRSAQGNVPLAFPG